MLAVFLYKKKKLDLSKKETLKTILILIACLHVFNSHAQSTSSINFIGPQGKLIHYAFVPINTDRSSASESSLTVKKGQLQIETGFSYIDDSESAIRNQDYNWNTTALRYGIGSDIELRAALNTRTNVITRPSNSTTPNQKSFGLDPLSVGAKIGLNLSGKIFESTAILINFGIKELASNFFKTQYSSHSLILANTSAINQKWSVVTNLGTQWTGSSSQLEALYTLGLNYKIKYGINVFIEAFGTYHRSFFPFFSTTVGRRVFSHNLNAGITYLISHRFQFDFTAGIGLNYIADDWFVSTGLAYNLKLRKKK